MWPRCGKQTFVPPAHEGSIWNLALIGPVVSEEKTFDECGQQTDGGACLYYYFTHEPKGSGELKITHIKKKKIMHFEVATYRLIYASGVLEAMITHISSLLNTWHPV